MAAMLAAAVVTAGVTFPAMLVVMVVTVNIGIVAQISAEQCAHRQMCIRDRHWKKLRQRQL